MKKYSATNKDFELYKKELTENSAENSWIVKEQDLFKEFKVKVDRETALQQVKKINSRYSTRLSLGKSKAPDESGELADFIVSESFQGRIMTKSKDEAAELVTELAHAAKTRGRYLLSFASKYCHHCNPNMYPIFDNVNLKYLKKHHSYTGKRDYRKYMETYSLFCKDIGVVLSKTKDKTEGFWVDKFINNIEKNLKKKINQRHYLSY